MLQIERKQVKLEEVQKDELKLIPVTPVTIRVPKAYLPYWELVAKQRDLSLDDLIEETMLKRFKGCHIQD